LLLDLHDMAQGEVGGAREVGRPHQQVEALQVGRAGAGPDALHQVQDLVVDIGPEGPAHRLRAAGIERGEPLRLVAEAGPSLVDLYLLAQGALGLEVFAPGRAPACLSQKAAKNVLLREVFQGVLVVIGFAEALPAGPAIGV